MYKKDPVKVTGILKRSPAVVNVLLEETMAVKHPVTAGAGGALGMDLYQFTMAAACHVNKMHMKATFELYVPELPPNRSFLVLAGVQPALEHVESFRFSQDDLDYLRGLPTLAGVPDDFFGYLSGFRFSGDVWAAEEGTPLFPLEPMVRVTAPLIEAQLVETLLLNIIDFETSVASKAARLVLAADDKGIVELGGRRAHGPEAARHAARAAFIAGVRATSNVEASRRYGIPVIGTMGHEFVKACSSEEQAFQYYARAFPSASLLMIDAVDPAASARQAVAFGESIHGVRIDAGDILSVSREVRGVLDGAGCTATEIIASGELDEHRIAGLVKERAPVDVFGVGSELVTSRDAPILDGVFRLVEIEGKQGPRYPRRSAPGKEILPGMKQIFRERDASGVARGDTIVKAGEVPGPREEALLRKVMVGGRIAVGFSSLEDLQERCRHEVSLLPVELRRLDVQGSYPVRLSEELGRLRDSLKSG
jgi:nicotinate phosphoribosyltransferase